MRMVFPHSTGRLINDMNALVESIFNDEQESKPVGYAPEMDITETEESYEFSLDLPGVHPDDIHVDLDDDRMRIHGTRHDSKADSKVGKRRIERSYGEFRRVVLLPKTVDREGIAADYDQGVLTITLPKAAQAGARRINVSHAGAAPDQN